MLRVTIILNVVVPHINPSVFSPDAKSFYTQTPSVNVRQLFSVTDDVVNRLRCFVLCTLFQANAMFASKAGTYPSVLHSMESSRKSETQRTCLGQTF